MQESLANTKEIHEVPAGGTPMVHWINIYGDHTLRISFKRRYAKHDEDTPDSAKHRSQSQLISGNLYCTGNNIYYISHLLPRFGKHNISFDYFGPIPCVYWPALPSYN